jgi:hypothetical protein
MTAEEGVIIVDDGLCRVSTAEYFTDWLVKYKGLPESSRENVISNLKEAFTHWELKGRLDRSPVIQIECPANGVMTIQLSRP